MKNGCLHRAVIDALETRRMLSASLVKDINTNLGSAQNDFGNQEITVSGGHVYFRADDGVHGPELWTFPDTTGTPTAPVMLKDIDPFKFNTVSDVRDPSYNYGMNVGPTRLTDVNGTLYFTEDDGVHGIQLWKTNGTTAGTVMVDDLNPNGSAYPDNLTNVNGTLYFTAFDSSGTQGLYKTDGTAAGTVLVKQFSFNIFPDAYNYQPAGTFSAVGNRLLFGVYNTSSGGYETWSSDGTAAGTGIISTSNNFAIEAAPATACVTLNGNSYVSAEGLNQTDGTTAGTTQIFYDFHPVQSLINSGGMLYFTCQDTNGILSLYKSDGTAAGTSLVTELEQITSTASTIVAVNGSLLIEADSGVSNLAFIWRSDGTAAGTTRFFGISADAPVAQHPDELVSTGTEAYFIGGDGTHNDELFQTDGTRQPSLVKDIRNDALTNESQAPVGVTTTQDLIASPTGKIYFSADDGVHGIELWSSDGTATGTAIVANINQTTDSSSPTDLVNYKGLTYFSANDGNGYSLFSTDGTAANTHLVGGEGQRGSDLTVANGLLYFSTASGLFETNGTSVSPVAPFNVSSSLAVGLTNCGGELYFLADVNRQPGIWVIPSAGATPVELVTINSSNGGGISPDFASVGSKVFFVFASAQGVTTLYTTQGTPASTLPVTTLSGVNGLVPFGNDVYFVSYDTTHGETLWRSDGTAQGTGIFANVPVAATGDDSDIAVAGNSIYFAAKNTTGSYQVFKSNGSAGSTAALPGTYWEIFNFTTFGNDLIFNASADDTGNYEAWISNGTASGTFPLSNAYLGAWGPDFTVDGSNVYFAAAATPSVAGGVQLWETDGTTTGTRQVALINPSGSGDPSNIDPLPNGSILFSAYTPAIGTELWKYTQPAFVPGKVSGSITANGIGVGGVTVYLDANGNSKLDSTELHTTTASNGSYAFTNVPAGSYSIHQILPAGYTQTTPASNAGLAITIASGSVLTGEKFVDAPPVVYKRLTGKTIGTSGSHNNAGNTIAKATDGNLSTYFDGPTANGDWVGFDLGSSKTIGQIAFAPRSGWASRMTGGKIQISTTANFTSGVTTIYTISTAPATGKLTFITLSKPVTARYVRYLSPNGGYGDISEFEVLG